MRSSLLNQRGFQLKIRALAPAAFLLLLAPSPALAGSNLSFSARDGSFTSGLLAQSASESESLKSEAPETESAAPESSETASPAAELVNPTRSDEPTTPSGYLIRGRNRRDQGLYEEAIRDFQDALERAQRENFIALVYYNWAKTLEEIGRISQAIERYEQAIEVDWQLTSAYRSLIRLLQERGDQEAAAAYQVRLDQVIKQLVEATVDGQPDAGTATRLISLGDDLRAERRHEEAIEFYDAAIALNPNLIAAYNNKAKSLEALNQFEDAAIVYQAGISVVSITRAQRNPSEADALSTTYSNLGDLYLRLGALQDAEDAYDRAVVTHPSLIASDIYSTEDFYVAGSLLGNQARALQRQGAADMAASRWQRALGSYRAAIAQNSSFAPAYNNLGVYYIEQGQTEEGLDFMQQAIDISPTPRRLQNLALTFLSLAQAARNAGDEAIAQDYTQRAVQAYLDIEKVLERVEEIPTRVRSSNLLDILLSRQDFTNFEASTTSSAQNQGYYALYIERLMWLHGSPNLSRGMNFETPLDFKAFQTAERARARGLQDNIETTRLCQQRNLATLSANVRTLIERQCDVQQQFSALVEAWQQTEDLNSAEALPNENSGQNERTAKLIELTSEFEQIQAQLIEEGVDLLRDDITLDEVQANLDDDTVLLEYWLGEEGSYLWAISKPGVISPSGFLSYELVLPGDRPANRRDINQLARNYYDYLTHPTQRFKPVSAARAGMELSQALLGPIAETLDELDEYRLVVVPDGMLNYVPFNALPHPNADQQFMTGAIADVDLDDLPEPLIRNHEIVHLPSFSTLLSIRERAVQRQPGNQTLAIVTDPALDNTGIEANRILEIAKQEDRDFESTSTTFEVSQYPVSEENLEDYRLIHFATHGRVIDTNLAESGLIYSPVNEDGEVTDETELFLSIPEVFSYDLPADLVVLSACRTGLGEEVTGEGMVGFSQGFLVAGASGVVVSLWSVNDEATRVLMEVFYDELLDNFDTRRNTPQTASALREAQLALWDEKRWNLPYYWAGFTFQGEWR